MTTASTGPTNSELQRILATDPVWAIYALADLQPEFAPYCRWQVEPAADGRTAIALLYRGLSPVVLLTAGAPDLLARCLERWGAEQTLPARVYLSMREEHEAAVARWYDNRADRRPMLRMALSDRARMARSAAHEWAPVRLGRADVERIKALYTVGGPFVPDAFDPYQLEDGVFFGVVGDDGELWSVGGTHIVDWRAGLGAIGNMYTHPQRRGNGLAGAILSAIVETLTAGGAQTIILNVDQRNTGARRLYEQHGFAVHCPYLEGIAVLRG